MRKIFGNIFFFIIFLSWFILLILFTLWILNHYTDFPVYRAMDLSSKDFAVYFYIFFGTGFFSYIATNMMLSGYFFGKSKK